MKKYSSNEINKKWIPCSDKLPDKEEKVLVTRGDIYIGVARYNPNYNKWSDEGHSLPDGYVNAWQPLPQSYKGE